MQSVGTPDAVFLEENLVNDAWGQALRSRMSPVGTGPAGERDFYAFETQGGTAGHVGGALCHRHRVHCCMFRYWESLT